MLRIIIHIPKKLSDLRPNSSVTYNFLASLQNVGYQSMGGKSGLKWVVFLIMSIADTGLTSMLPRYDKYYMILGQIAKQENLQPIPKKNPTFVFIRWKLVHAEWPNR